MLMLGHRLRRWPNIKSALRDKHYNDLDMIDILDQSPVNLGQGTHHVSLHFRV